MFVKAYFKAEASPKMPTHHFPPKKWNLKFVGFFKGTMVFIKYLQPHNISSPHKIVTNNYN
jgi:hypothetical protein